MKSGVKNCDSNGKGGPIPVEKAQRRVDDYFATLEVLHPDDFEQRKNDGKLDADALYQSSGNGLAHGRVPIANGAVRKSEMKASARGTRQSTSGSYQYLVRRNRQLEKGYKIGLVLSKHMPDLFTKMNLPVPEEIIAILQGENTCAPSIDQVSQSSSEAENGAGSDTLGNRDCGNGNNTSGNSIGASGNGNDGNEDDPNLE